MKLTKGKIIVAVAVIAVLAGAFWYGGNAPGLQGWTVQEQESSAVLEAAPPASGPEESIAPIVTPGGEAESPPPTVSGMKTVEAHRVTIPRVVARPRELAEMSRKVSSSAPAAL